MLFYVAYFAYYKMSEWELNNNFNYVPWHDTVNSLSVFLMYGGIFLGVVSVDIQDDLSYVPDIDAALY